MITITKNQLMLGFATAWFALPIDMRASDLEVIINDGNLFVELKQDPRKTLWWNGQSWEKDDV